MAEVIGAAETHEVRRLPGSRSDGRARRRDREQLVALRGRERRGHVGHAVMSVQSECHIRADQVADALRQ